MVGRRGRALGAADARAREPGGASVGFRVREPWGATEPRAFVLGGATDERTRVLRGATEPRAREPGGATVARRGRALEGGATDERRGRVEAGGTVERRRILVISVTAPSGRERFAPRELSRTIASAARSGARILMTSDTERLVTEATSSIGVFPSTCASTKASRASTARTLARSTTRGTSEASWAAPSRDDAGERRDAAGAIVGRGAATAASDLRRGG